MKGKLIIIEAGDGSGKATQTERLYARLTSENYPVRKVEFPNYTSPSSALVKMYLNGEFGQDANSVNPYAASAFYAVDRYASFKKEWEAFYQNGGIVLSDRYTTSNMVHQAAKISSEDEWNNYLIWLTNFEYKLFGLPAPDCVIFLDMPPEYSLELVAKRAAANQAHLRDIHEQNADYLTNSYYNAKKVAQRFDWLQINCIKDSELRTINDIHEEIYSHLKRNIL